MLVGQNERLERALELLEDDDSPVYRDDILNIIMQSVAVGDKWRVPVDFMEEDMDEPDYPDGLQLSLLPGFVKKTLETTKDKHLS